MNFKTLGAVFLVLTCLNLGYTQNPGGISTEIQFWLKADAGALHGGFSANDGQMVEEWVDQSGVRTNHATIGAVSAGFPTFTPEGPTFRNNPADNINYNPVLAFDGVNDGLNFGNDYIFSSGTGAQDGMTFLFVAKADPSTAKERQYLIDFGRRRGDTTMGTYSGMYGDDFVQILSPSVSPFNDDTPTTFFGQTDNTETTLVRFVFDFDFERQEISLNSNKINFYLEDNTTSRLTAAEIPDRAAVYQNNRGPVTIGRQSRQRDLDSNNGRLFQGKIAEVIGYSKRYNAIEAWKIESYLMIKYGITTHTNSSHELNTGDYLASNTARIWDSRATDFEYRHHIIGIGRDDASGLEQKQSHTADDSIRVYLGAIAPTNADNPNTINNDLSFIVIGDENSKLQSNGSIEMPAGLSSRLEREWKVTNTNFVNNFSWDITLNAEALAAGFGEGDLRLLVDDDGDFSNAIAYASGDQGISISYSSGVISIGEIPNSIIPQNSTAYMTIALFNTILPVELLDFTAEVVGDRVFLAWQTLSEINHDYFSIERSVDTRNWEEIQKLRKQENTDKPSHYSLYDEAPLKGISYYRLKQTDFDGQYTYSNIRSIYFQSLSESQILIYANPTEDEFKIKGMDLEGEALIQIYSTSGQLMSEQHLDIQALRNTSFSTSSLSSGSYIIRCYLRDRVYTSKLIVR